MSVPRSILIVEDEPLISMMLEDFVLSLGHQVSATCETVADALAQIERTGSDMAILDVNLKGESVWPVARALKAKGTPFVLSSGGFVETPPPEFEGVAMIEKPYTIDRVAPVIDETLKSLSD